MRNIVSKIRYFVSNGELIRSLKWQYFANISVGIVGAIYILLLGKALGVYDFGKYAIIVATPALVSNCFDLRLQETIIFLQSRLQFDRDDVNSNTIASILVIDFVARTIGLILSIIGGILVANYVGVRAGLDVAIAAAFVTFAGKAGNSPAMGILRVRDELDYFAKCQVSDWLLRTAFLIGLERLGILSLLTVLLSQICSASIHNILIINRANNSFGRDAGHSIFIGFKSIRRTWRSHRRLFLNGQAISISDSVIKELDTIVIASVLSVSSVGIYKMAKNFAAIAWRAADPVYIVILPRLTQLRGQANGVALRLFIRNLSLFLLVLSVVLFVGSVIAANLGVWLILGPGFAETATVFPLAGAWILVCTPLIWTHSLAFAAGRPEVQTKASAIGNLVGLIAIYFGSLWLGLPGAALGLSIAYVLPFLLAFLFLRSAGLTR